MSYAHPILSLRDTYNPGAEILKQGDAGDVFSSYIREVYLGPYIATWLELIEQGYCLHLLSRYYKQPAPTYERLAIGIASLIGLYLTIIHSLLMISYLTEELYQINSLSKVHWQLFSTNLVGGIVLCIVQSLYAHRIILITPSTPSPPPAITLPQGRSGRFRFGGSRRLWVGVGLGLAIAGCLACNTIALYSNAAMPKLSSIFDPNVANLNSYFKRVEPWIILSYCGNIVVDTIICIGSVWTMKHNSDKSGERLLETKTAIREYIGISAKSMLFPTLCSAASIGIHAYKISGTYDAIAVFSISKLSLISILHLTLARERYRGRLKNTGVLEGTKVLMHVQTEVVYSTASDYPMTKRRHAGLRCPSETDLASSMGDLSPSSSGKQMLGDDYDQESVEGRGGRLFWSNRR